MSNLTLDFLCTYKLISEDDEEDSGLQEILYRIQLLQFLNMTSFEENDINKKISDLYIELIEESFVKKILLNHCYKNTIEDSEILFRTLFSFDYFDLFYNCLQCFYNNNNNQLEQSVSMLIDNFEAK
tara:strand:- start:1556 stop:1936 length:381 start_codon:yes stop_codon:yes gene_type:complete